MNCNFMTEAKTKIYQIKPKHYRVNRKRHEKQETSRDSLMQGFQEYNQKKRKEHEQKKCEQKKINALHQKREYAYNGGYLGNNKDKLWDYYEYKEKLPQMLNEAEQRLKRINDEKIDALLQENAQEFEKDIKKTSASNDKKQIKQTTIRTMNDVKMKNIDESTFWKTWKRIALSNTIYKREKLRRLMQNLKQNNPQHTIDLFFWKCWQNVTQGTRQTSDKELQNMLIDEMLPYVDMVKTKDINSYFLFEKQYPEICENFKGGLLQKLDDFKDMIDCYNDIVYKKLCQPDLTAKDVENNLHMITYTEENFNTDKSRIKHKLSELSEKYDKQTIHSIFSFSESEENDPLDENIGYYEERIKSRMGSELERDYIELQKQKTIELQKQKPPLIKLEGPADRKGCWCK